MHFSSDISLFWGYFLIHGQMNQLFCFFFFRNFYLIILSLFGSCPCQWPCISKILCRRCGWILILCMVADYIKFFFPFCLVLTSGCGCRFAAALKDLKVWVMNIVTVDSPDTLPIIYERGLFGMYHDWCESFSTYPRSYDLLHADHLFSLLKKRCAYYYISHLLISKAFHWMCHFLFLV